MRILCSPIIILLPFLNIGCGKPHNTCVGPACNAEGTTSAAFCTYDSDCGNGQHCAAGKCEYASNGPCTTHNDCPASRYCNSTGSCVECLNIDHCEPPLVCRPSGVCGDERGCSTDVDCTGGVCDTDTGDCVQCLGNDDCAPGYNCTGRQCVPSTSTGGCTTAYDCAGPNGCVDGTCGACVWDTDCRAGETCSVGTCQSITTSGGVCNGECDIAYTACTCGLADPCGWQNDGYCDEGCATGFPSNHFDDSADCGGTTSSGCGTECLDGLYSACTCAADDPCGWSNDGLCDDSCAINFPTNYFDDGADCGGGGSGACGTDCTEELYTACSCAADDPCGWSNDGWCDDYCANFGATFDESLDCY